MCKLLLAIPNNGDSLKVNLQTISTKWTTDNLENELFPLQVLFQVCIPTLVFEIFISLLLSLLLFISFLIFYPCCCPCCFFLLKIFSPAYPLHNFISQVPLKAQIREIIDGIAGKVCRCSLPFLQISILTKYLNFKRQRRSRWRCTTSESSRSTGYNT